MVSPSSDSSNPRVVTGHMLTVTTASVTGDAVYQLSDMDLAMKLHYLRILYYFRPSETVGGITTPVLKEPMFPDCFCQAAGRIRKSEAGRPHIKCNDSGVRIVEASCEQSMDEWLETKGPDWDGQLVPDRVVGPDLYFSPLIFLQFTRFKCGGLAVGVSWSHVLGDAVSASNCINLWGRLLAGKPAPAKPQHSSTAKNLTVSPATREPLSLKQVEPNGDIWLPQTKYRMVTSSFRITITKLNNLQSKISGHIPAFEAISAIIWKSLAKVRAEKEPNLVTVIRNDCSDGRNEILSNKQIINTVAADSSLANIEVSELATLISETSKDDEKKAIEEVVQRENGTLDFIVYGANLTFINMDGVDLYGFDLKGQKPVCMEYNISGVGDEGAVLVLQEPDDGGKTVTVILPEHEMPKLKEVLGSEWGIA